MHTERGFDGAAGASSSGTRARTAAWICRRSIRRRDDSPRPGGLLIRTRRPVESRRVACHHGFVLFATSLGKKRIAGTVIAGLVIAGAGASIGASIGAGFASPSCTAEQKAGRQHAAAAY